jgi:myosin-18
MFVWLVLETTVLSHLHIIPFNECCTFILLRWCLEQVQISRLKETVEKLQGEAAMARAKEQTAQDAVRKLQRTVRELKEEASAGQARETEAAQRRKDLEKRLESADAEAAAARGDLRLALTRIQDLQSAIQGELEDCSGSDHSDR